MRAYVHEAGFSLFGKLDERHDEEQDPRVKSLFGAANHLDQILENLGGDGNRNGEDLDFIVALLWGDTERNELVADLVGFRNMHPWPGNPYVWPGNPDVTLWRFRNEHYRQESRDHLCGDDLILLGQEELHRREQRDLQSYAQTSLFLPPMIRSDDYRLYLFPEYPCRSIASDLPRERLLPKAPRPA